MVDATLFRKVARGDHPCLHASSLLGWEFIYYEPDKRRVKVRFHASSALTTALGHIQSGMLAAMLDDCMGASVFAALGPNQSALCSRIEARLEKTAYPGHIAGIGIITRWQKDTCFSKGELWDEAGNRLATARGTYKLITLALDHEQAQGPAP